MNNWKYAARDVPTDASDGYNGQNSVVRELRLERQGGGWYSLLSCPVTALSNYVSSTTTLPDRTVNGSYVLPWSGRAYELELDISWDAAANVGVSVGRSADGVRHTNIGKYGAELYVDRAPSDLAGYSLRRRTPGPRRPSTPPHARCTCASSSIRKASKCSSTPATR